MIEAGFDSNLIHSAPFRSRARPCWLVSPAVDLLMAGGLSFILYFCCLLFSDGRMASPVQISRWVLLTSFVANFPHFLISYQLLYFDYRKKILRDPLYAFSGIAVPFILFCGCVAALFGKPIWLQHWIHLMYFTVGWHYVRQVYGVFLVTSAREGTYFTYWERAAVNASLLFLAAVNMVSLYNLTPYPVFSGVALYRISFPYWALPVSESLLLIFSLLAAALLVTKYLRTGAIPSLTGMVAILAMYLWYLPGFTHPVFFLTVPFMHCIQYLWMVGVFRWNKLQQTQTQVTSEQSKRADTLIRFWGYVALAFATGAAFFYFIPNYLDAQRILLQPAFGASGFAAIFTMFINVHHFFIDASLWRRSNPEVAMYLGGPWKGLRQGRHGTLSEIGSEAR